VKKPLIFLSYAHDDQDTVRDIYKRLQFEGYKPWMDQFDILAGEDWERAIRTAIKKADFFLIFLSDHSVNRRGVLQKELRAALDSWNGMLPSDIYLIPVRLSNCTIPDELSYFQWVDLFIDLGWNKLMRAIVVSLRQRKNDPRNKK
jgi:hypothetical protein